MKPAFAILPYIKTKEFFHVAGITFRSNQDTKGLTPEEVDHLKGITSLFYLADDKPINEVVYALLRLSDDRDQSNAHFRQLRAAHTILTFLVTKEYATYEQSALYVVIPTQVFEESSSSFVPGYSVTINWLHWLEIAQGKKLYPPLPYPGALTPHGWNLSDFRLEMKAHPALLYGLQEFVRGEMLDQPEQADRFETILRAMSWYNKSFSQFISEEEKVVHLAVAFEILFHQQESSQAIREELKRHLRGLFGEAPRLNDWVDQFYDERSNILHEGFSTRLDFVVGDKRPTERQLVMDSLVNYGRRLLRMCIFNILHATLLAERTNLNAWFTHDKERLQEICKQLRDETIPSEQRLLSVVKLIYDLGEIWVHYRHQQTVDLKTVHAAGKRLIQTYLETYPKTETAIRQRLQRIMSMGLDSPCELVDAYSELANELGRGVATDDRGKYWPRKPGQALAHFAKYAGSYHFKRKAYYLAKGEEQKH